VDKIVEHMNERVVFWREIKLSENTVEIQSEIITQTRSTPIYYRMVLEKDQWKVYDIVIEEVSLVMNYRSQFREILSNKSPAILWKCSGKKFEVELRDVSDWEQSFEWFYRRA
jgi:phospholipid transport system substrate-binding protein